MTKLEAKLNELQIFPRHYGQLAYNARMSTAQAMQLVTGKAKINRAKAEQICDGIWLMLGKKVTEAEVME